MTRASELEITWEQAAPVAAADERLVARLLARPGEWGPLSVARRVEIARALGEAQGRMSLDQVISFHHWHLTERAMRRHRQLGREAAAICWEHDEEHRPLLALSHARDFAPVAMFRAILKARRVWSGRTWRGAYAERTLPCPAPPPHRPAATPPRPSSGC